MSGGLAKGFLDDIVANIDDDTPRLVYADWLMENDRDDRAEFIRVQVELARLPAWGAARVALRLRERALLHQHAEEWLAEVPAVEGARWEGFRRGIVAEVRFASFATMRANAHLCRAVAPVEAVSVRWPRKREGRKSVKPIAELRELTLTGTPEFEAFAWLAESPQLATLRRLTAGDVWSDLPGLLASPHLANLRSLRLPSNNLGRLGLAALPESATLTALEELDFSSLSRHERYPRDSVMRAAALRALMDWPGLATVRSLNLNGNDMTRDGLRALLRSPHAAALKELSLRDTRLGGAAMAEFASAVPGLRLETLDVGDNVLKGAGADHVANAPCLGELKALRLDRCEIPLAGAKALAKAGFLGGLRVLEVGHNYFGPAGLAALLEQEPAALHTLGVRDNNLFDKGAVALSGSPASDGLLELDLGANGLGDTSAVVLGATEHLRGLLVLRLGDDAITPSARAALAASPLGRRLGVLESEEQPASETPPFEYYLMPYLNVEDAPPPAPEPPGEDDIPF